MNYPDSGTATTPGKKTRFSSAARALVVGLALLLPGAAALASSNPIPGVDIIVKKNPGPSGPISAPTGADGTYQFKGLAPGKYDLSIAGRLVQTISVDKGSISGVLSREPDGKASITFNGKVGVVPDLPSAPVNTTRSNKKAGIAKADAPPPDDVLPSAPVSTSRSNKKAGIAVGDVNGDGRAEIRTVPPKTDGTGKPGISDQGFIGNLSSGRITGVAVDPSEPSKTGHAPKPTSPGTGSHRSLKAGGSGIPPKVGISGTLAISENNSPLPQDRQIITGAGPSGGPHVSPKGGDEKPGISDQGAAGGLISYSTAPPPKGEAEQERLRLRKAGDPIPGVDVRGTDAEKPGLAGPGDPIPGTEVGLEGDPEGVKVRAKTDVNGAYQFTGLPAGKYKLTFPGLPAKSITIGTHGKTGGKVLRDGNNVIVSGDFEGSPARSQASANPVPGFVGGVFPGMGSTFGGILPGMTPGAGGPGAGGPGAGPMGPAAGSIRR